MSRDAFDAAEDLLDPDHRLPGEVESESSPLLEDALHWAHVYEELLGFKRGLLDAVQDRWESVSEGVSEAVSHEIAGDDTVLRTELVRLERRHRFWQQRVEQLGGA